MDGKANAIITRVYYYVNVTFTRESEERLMVWRSLSRVGWKDEEGSFFPLYILPWITKKWFFPFRSLFHLIGLKAREACSNLLFLTWYLGSSCCKTGLSLSLSHGENSFSLWFSPWPSSLFASPTALPPSFLASRLLCPSLEKRGGKEKLCCFSPNLIPQDPNERIEPHPFSLSFPFSCYNSSPSMLKPLYPWWESFNMTWVGVGGWWWWW